MNKVVYIIEILHEVVIDLTTSFLRLPALIQSIRIPSLPAAQPKVTTPTPATAARPKNSNIYLKEMRAFYISLEETMENGNVPAYFALGTICIIVGCTYIFYKVLITF